MRNLFIYTYICRDMLTELLKNGNEETFVLEADYPLSHLNYPKMGVASYDGFITKEDYRYGDSFIAQFWNSWSIFDGIDICEWKGIGLSDAVAGMLRHPIYKTIREITIAQNAINEIAPDVIYCGEGDSVNPQVWLEVGKVNGISVETLSPLEEEAPMRLGKWFYKEISSSRNRKCILSSIWRKVRTLSGLHFNKTQGDISDIHFKPKPDIILLTKKPLKELPKVGITIDEITTAGFSTLYLDSDPIACIREKTKSKVYDAAYKYFSSMWDKINCTKQISKCFLFRGLNILPFLLANLKPIFLDVLPLLAVESETAGEVIKEISPKALLGKVHYQGPYSVWKAHARNSHIKDISLQRENLIPGANEGWPKISADWMLTLGPSSDRFIRNNFESDKVKIIQYGTPIRQNIQNEVKSCAKRHVKGKYKLSNKPVILYADSHYCSTSLRDSPIRLINGLKMVYECAKKLPEYQFLIKIHPGGPGNHREGKYYYSRRLKLLERYAPSNLVWLPVRSKATDIFSLNPVVVSVYSYMCIEAMATNLVPIYLFSLEDGNELPDFESPLPSALCVRNKEELAPTITSIVDNYKSWSCLLKEGQRKYFEYIYSDYSKPISIIKDILN